ncbi:extracellular solute-binding protein [Paenibacillus senegalensis]|uniref:extracellular solute-binding protein n=1 Tax=Paenibacillus senegalensis TaxID=1465766 RepID=UPI0002889C42|nr:extracellular solute-binding protein [Paenibacillus senegalensis]
MTRKKYLLVLFAIVGLSILLITQVMAPEGGARQTAIPGRDTLTGTLPGRADNDTENIIMAVSMKEEEYAVLQETINDYLDTVNRVQVELLNLPPGEAYEYLKKASQLGQAPDLMLLNNDWVNEFAALGYLQPVDEVIGSEQHLQIVDPVLNQVKWNGYTWAVPKDIDPYILAWNTGKAEELNGGEPPRTAEQMVHWNRQGGDAEAGIPGVYYDPADPYALLSLLSALGVPSPQGEIPFIHMDNEITLQALQSFYYAEQESSEEREEAAEQPQRPDSFHPLPGNPWELLKKGKLSAMITTISEFKLYADSSAVELSALPMIKEDNQETTGTWLKGRSYAISSKTEAQTAVADLLKALTTMDAEMNLWSEAKVLPAIVSAYMAPAIKSDPSYRSYTWLIEQGNTIPVQIDLAKKMHELDQAMEQFADGQQDLAAFANYVASLWKQE